MKPPRPPMELDEISPEEFMKFSREELDKIPFDLVRWQCKIKLCKCFSRVRDYGIDPWYYMPRGLRGADGKTFYWVNTRKIFLMCHKHKKYWKLPVDDIPLKRTANGGIVWGWDDTGKQMIIY